MPDGFGDEAVLVAVARSAAALVVLDADGRVVRWSAGAEQLFGWRADAAVGSDWHDLGLTRDPVRRSRADEVLAATLGGHGSTNEWVAIRPDDRSVRVHSVFEPLLDKHGVAVGIVAISVDLSAREAFEAALLREALHDRLTGLPGRSVLDHELTAVLDERRGSVPRSAVLFIDLDDFKVVNDTYGHDVGDRVLVEVARRLRHAVRGDDVVARVGGDEFVALVRLDGSPTDGFDVAERIVAAIAEPVSVEDGPVVDIAASVGVALADPGESAEAVVRRADTAMYRAKRSSDQRSPAV